jgi:hypothetical protein
MKSTPNLKLGLIRAAPEALANCDSEAIPSLRLVAWPGPGHR